MTPTAFASWPMHVCVVPASLPSENSSSSDSSKRRISTIRSYSAGEIGHRLIFAQCLRFACHDSRDGTRVRGIRDPTSAARRAPAPRLLSALARDRLQLRVRAARAARRARRRDGSRARPGRRRAGTPPPHRTRDVDGQLPRRLPQGELRDGARVGADDERGTVACLRRRRRAAAASSRRDRRSARRRARAASASGRRGSPATRRRPARSRPGAGQDRAARCDDLVVELGAVHVVRALHLRLVGEALAPRLAVVGDERDRRAARAGRGRRAPGGTTAKSTSDSPLDRLAGSSRAAPRAPPRSPDWMPAMMSSFAARHSLRSEWRTS